MAGFALSTEVEKRLLPWCAAGHYHLLKQLDVDAVREFRSEWPDGPITAQKNLERLRAFFWFCHSAGWVKNNPASAVKSPSPGNPSERVKVFTEEQIKKVLKACDRYPERNSFGHDNPARVRAADDQVALGELRVLFEAGMNQSLAGGANPFDVTPDNRFVLIRGLSAVLSNRVVLVQNWVEELTRLVQ